MTLRELLEQHNIDLDQELIDSEVEWGCEPVEGPPQGMMRTMVPGPWVDIDVHLTIAAKEKT